MNEKDAIELARSHARNCNILEHAAHKYLQGVDARWMPHEWVVRAILAAYERGAATHVPAAFTDRVRLERSNRFDELTKLRGFLRTQTFEELPDDARALMWDQEAVMAALVDILDRRIAAFAV